MKIILFIFIIVTSIPCNSNPQSRLYSGEIKHDSITGTFIYIQMKNKANDYIVLYNFFIDSDYFNINLLNIDKLLSIERNRDSIFLLCTGTDAYFNLNYSLFNGELPFYKYYYFATDSTDSLKIITVKKNNYYYKYSRIEAQCLVFDIEKEKLIYSIPIERFRFKNKYIRVFLLQKVKLLK